MSTVDSDVDSEVSLQEFNAEFLKVLPRLYRRAVFLAGAARAEDAVHDAYLKLSARPERFANHPEPYAYAFAAVVSAVRDSIRRTGRQVLVEQVPDGPEDWSRPIDLREAQWEATRLLGELSERQAAAVLLVDLDGYTIDEAAAILKVHRGTVSRARARALAALRVLVEG
jgi:RNA polymerase sigma factor (sigma-70 family)